MERLAHDRPHLSVHQVVGVPPIARPCHDLEAKQQEERVASSGTIRPLYGVIIRDRCKSADAATLKAYKVVAQDMLKGLKGEDAKDLEDALKDVDKALAAKK